MWDWGFLGCYHSARADVVRTVGLRLLLAAMLVFLVIFRTAFPIRIGRSIPHAESALCVLLQRSPTCFLVTFLLRHFRVCSNKQRLVLAYRGVFRLDALGQAWKTLATADVNELCSRSWHCRLQPHAPYNKRPRDQLRRQKCPTRHLQHS